MFSNGAMLKNPPPRGKTFCAMNRPITVQLLTGRLGGEAHGELCSSRSREVSTRSPLAVSPLLRILCSANPLAASPHPLPSPVLGALFHHPFVLHQPQEKPSFNFSLTCPSPTFSPRPPPPQTHAHFRAEKLQSNKRCFRRTGL